jgi:prephenate dehydrogenase
MNLGDRFAGSNVHLERVGGFGAARPDRLEGQIVYVTPVKEGEQAAREVADFWQRVTGAEPVMVEAEVHDRLMAWVSHLPQAVASALAQTLAAHGPRGVTYGPSALSTSAAAVVDDEEWADTMIQNREYLAEVLEALGSEVLLLKTALLQGDREAVRKWIGAGSRWRRRSGE